MEFWSHFLNPLNSHRISKTDFVFCCSCQTDFNWNVTLHRGDRFLYILFEFLVFSLNFGPFFWSVGIFSLFIWIFSCESDIRIDHKWEFMNLIWIIDEKWTDWRWIFTEFFGKSDVNRILLWNWIELNGIIGNRIGIVYAIVGICKSRRWFK